MIRRDLIYSVVALAVSLGTNGCSAPKDELPREPVAGTVTMDGQPLAEATIQFYPKTSSDPNAVGANAEVKDGKFSIPREDGLVVGSYQVKISHAEVEQVKTKAKGTLSKPTRLGKELIPETYNRKTTLTAEIPKGGKSDLRFPLQSK